MGGRSTSLKTFVYRRLAVRVALAALVVAMLLTLVILARSRESAADYVAEEVDKSIAVLLAQGREILARPDVTDPKEAFRTALEKAFGEEGLFRRSGIFRYSRFYNRDGEVFAERERDDYGPASEVRDLAGETPVHYPDAGDKFLEIVEIGGRPHVHIVSPIEDLEGRVVAWGETYFAVSDAVISDVRRDLIESILWVVFVVLVTSAILYPVIISLTRRLADYSERLLDSHLETVQILGSAIAKRDSDTSAHNFRVTIMSVRMGEALGLAPRTMQLLIKGAFLHDVGKIGITDNILLKPARLDEDEFTVMKTHVTHGIDIVTRREWLQEERHAHPEHVEEGVSFVKQMSWLDEAAQVVGGHHEKFDGSGYPRGLKGEDIPLVARIFAIADVFDALTCQRPYKKPFSFEKSMSIMEEGRGTHFDPRVLDAFVSLSEGIYRDLANREDEGLKDDLAEVTRTYFQAGLASLTY